jgi:hypothetical protein
VIKLLEKLRFGVRSRAHAFELTKTLFLVGILTVLIWIYAERAQNATATIQVGLDVRVTNAMQFATLIEPINTPITAEIEGPRSKLDQIRNQLGRRIPVVLPGSYESDTETNIQTVPLLNDYPEIRGLGVTVTSASPSAIRVRIDPRVPRRVPLTLPENMPFEVTNYSITPAEVDVTAPVPLMNRLFPTRESGIPVDLTGYPMERYNTPGIHTIESVPILVPREPGVQVSPQRPVTVRFEVSAREAEVTLRTVPLVIQLPLPAVNRWAITTREQTVTNIQLRGPATEIAKLQSIDNRPPEVTPVAVLRIANDDRGVTDATRPISIDGLPPGVTPVGPLPNVEFSVRETGSPE